jgi:methanol--5-hydroxybenzimidazolylcobamide Co-methyltransferase
MWLPLCATSGATSPCKISGSCPVLHRRRSWNCWRTTADYRSLLVQSDISLSPQALVLSPESTIAIAKAIVGAPDPYRQTIAAARTAVTLIDEAHKGGNLPLAPRELEWLGKIDVALDNMPEGEEGLIGEMTETYAHKFLPSSYGL